MEWNNARTLTFIEDYHNSPELWNNKINEYTDNRIKNCKLKKLAIKHKCTIPELKNKIKNLRSQYHRERKRVQSSSQKEAKWFAFEHLSFLTDVYLPKVTRSTAGSDEHTEVVKGEQADSKNTGHVQVKDNELENLNEVSNKCLRMNRSEECEMKLVPKLNTQKNLSHSDREEEVYNILKSNHRDDCSTYGEHVGNELRKLIPRAQAVVKHMINNILFEAAMGKYDVENKNKRKT